MRISSFVGVLALVVAWQNAARAEEGDAQQPRRMSVGDCVAEALVKNYDVKTAEDEQAVARAQRWEIGGQTLPRLHVDLAGQAWGAPYDVSFAPPPSPPIRLHDAFTWEFTAEFVQPITPLIPLLDAYHVRDLGVDIAGIKRDATKRDVAYRVIESYYRVLESERLAAVASESVDLLTAQLKQANSFHDAGVVSKDDVLRAELALANAKQRVIQTKGRVTTSRASLSNVMGVGPQTPIDAVPLAGQPDAHNETTLGAAEQNALAHRVEIRELDQRVGQSRANVRISWAKLFPNINLIGAYNHNEQVGSGLQLVEKDAVYLGMALSWDVWDWGANISGIHESEAKLREARTARDKMRDQIDLEVRDAFVNVDTAIEANTVAKASVVSAEEHYRLVKKRYEANTTTSFDVVDAENLLTLARAQLETSIYDYLIARTALRRAMGESPDQQLAP
jgi:outer membrane protein